MELFIIAGGVAFGLVIGWVTYGFLRRMAGRPRLPRSRLQRQSQKLVVRRLDIRSARP
jgi:NhaP-type Na+/H+ or K+/H+ antiporter